jgi:hypothetical protein
MRLKKSGKMTVEAEEQVHEKPKKEQLKVMSLNFYN